MNCPNCGKQIEDGSRFCPSCGYKLSDAEIAEGVRASQAEDESSPDTEKTMKDPGELDPSVTQVIDDIHTEMETEDPYTTYRSARAREYREAREAERRSMNYDGPGRDGRQDDRQEDPERPTRRQDRRDDEDRYYRGSIEDDYRENDYRERDYRESRDYDDNRRRDSRDYDDSRRHESRDYDDARERDSREDYEDPRRRDDRDGFTYEYADRREARGGRKKRDGGLIALVIILIGVVIVAAVLVLMLIRSRNQAAENLTQVKLNGFLNVEVKETEEGSGTYTAEATFDSAAFAKKYGDQIVFDGTSSDRKKLAPDAKSDAELLAKSCIQGSLDKSEGLTEADTITFKWNCDSDTAAQYFGIELVYSDQTYQMSKLIEEMPKVEIATSSSEAASSSSEEEENPAIQNAENEASQAAALVWNGSLIGTRDQYNQAKSLADALPDSSEVKKELEDELAQADAALTEQEKAAAEEAARKAAEEEAARKAEEEKQQAQNTPQQATDTSGQLFPNSSSQAVSQDQLSGMSASQLQQAINEIYARHGYAFQDASIRAYFEQFSWYNPTVSDMGSISFNQTEQDNISRMSAERNARNGQ